MARTELPFADGFYISLSRPLLNKRVINLIPVIPEADAASSRALFHTPGIIQKAVVADNKSRGVLVFSDGTPYRVIGNSLYSISASNVVTNHGTISGTEDVSMASNGINISIQDPTGNNYFFTPATSVLETNTNSAFLNHGQAETVTFKDGFYVYTTQLIFFSSSAKTVNDGKNFNALDFADAEINPDLINKGLNDHNQLYIGGDNTTEVLDTIVTTGFPFQRIPGAIIPKGIRAPNSVVDFAGAFLFIGGGKGEKSAVWRILGSSFEKVSTASIDSLIQSNTEEAINKARAFSYAQDGHSFAVFTVGDNTFVYDDTTSRLSGKREWHERQSGITNGDGFLPWRAMHGALVNGKIQVSDDRSGLIGELDFDTYDEYGNEIEKIFSTKPFSNQLNTLFSDEIELFMKTGIGNSDVEDPQIRMDYSDNGTRSFNNEISRSMGKVGEYEKVIKWEQLGEIPSNRVLRFKTTVKAPVEFYSLFASAEASESG